MDIREIKAEDTWPLRSSVMWPDRPLDYVKLENDGEGLHFGAFEGNTLTSVVSLFISQNQAQFRKLATDISSQGKGLASTLIKYVFNYSKQKQVQRIWCNARKDKRQFYHKFGMKETNQTFTKGGIDYIIMEYHVGRVEK